MAEARVAFTGIASVGFRDSGVEDALKGQPADESSFAKAVEKAAEGQDLNDDAFSGEEYRRHLAKVFAKRALLKASESL